EGRRNYFLAFIGGFHGRTLGSLSLTASKPVHRRFFFPMVPGVIHVPYPYCYRCPFKMEYPSCGIACLDYIREWIFDKYVPSEELAAAVIEPIAGEGGYVPAPKEFMIGLKKMVEEYGGLLMVDEVQSGFGRTGKLFGYMHMDIEPDLVAVAKGIASGMPLGALIGRRDVMTLPGGTHANTFGGNPVSLAAADKTLDKLLGGLIDNSAKVGSYLMKRLGELQEKYDVIGDVRGMGLMIGVEFVKDRESKEPNKEVLERVINASFRKGLIVIGSGVSTLRLSPPLNINVDVVDEAVEILEEALKESIE
ncbi:TPA: aminotransferase class III-fold pyridoxal phosphate-dependent enzyme, partial [Candidatus Geothermarchaeota archaeon]|nr:aminotransferase class III-fold pyridoxal phosphate-dependent enzyme [Candidatus Geothermarchaeota archaeon]